MKTIIYIENKLCLTYDQLKNCFLSVTSLFIYTFLYLHFKSVILGQNKTVITEIVICNRFFSGIEMHTFIAPKTMTISSQSYEL